MCCNIIKVFFYTCEIESCLQNTKGTTLSVVYSGFESGSGKTVDYKIGMCCFSAKHIALRRQLERHFYPWTFVSVS